MKSKIFIVILFFCTIFLGCNKVQKDYGSLKVNITSPITDVFGKTVHLPENPRVISAYGSFSECWLLSGGKLVGVTDDAISERKLDLSENIEIIGTVKSINLEKVISLNPDYVILSADIASQASLGENFDNLGIDYGYFRVDSFDDYSKMMKQFCNFHKTVDLYDKNVNSVDSEIRKIKESAVSNSENTYLLMRVYSTGIKVKTDNTVDTILKELGGVSIADKVPSLLKDLSVEEVIKSNPKYIFVLTMGDEKEAKEYFNANIVNNPAWNGLSAIKNGNYHILPKILFHYKPNNRWAQSYKYIADILYSEVERYDK